MLAMISKIPSTGGGGVPTSLPNMGLKVSPGGKSAPAADPAAGGGDGNVQLNGTPTCAEAAAALVKTGVGYTMLTRHARPR